MEPASARPTTRETISRSEQQYDRGRIRLTEEDAAELYQALALRVGALLDTRGELVDLGHVVMAPVFNRKISALRRAMGEIERTAGEKNWTWALSVVEAYGDGSED